VTNLAAFTFWASFLALAAAVLMDLRHRRIPNWVVAPYFLAGLLARGAGGAEPLLIGLAGCVIAATAAGALHLVSGLGMGDVKLIAAFGLWVGPAQLEYALPSIALAGGLLAVVYVAYNALGSSIRAIFRPQTEVSPDQAAITGGSQPRVPLTMPYAPAIAVGAMFSFFAG